MNYPTFPSNPSSSSPRSFPVTCTEVLFPSCLTYLKSEQTFFDNNGELSPMVGGTYLNWVLTALPSLWFTRSRIQVKYFRKERHGLCKSNARKALGRGAGRVQQFHCHPPHQHLPKWNFILVAPLHSGWMYESPWQVKDGDEKKSNISTPSFILPSVHKLKYSSRKNNVRTLKSTFRKINAEMFI